MLNYKAQMTWGLGLLVFSIVYSVCLHLWLSYKQGASLVFAIEYGAVVWLLSGLISLIPWVATGIRVDRVFFIYIGWSVLILVGDFLAAIRIYGTHWTLPPFD
jgi:hypothetical protein